MSAGRPARSSALAVYAKASVASRTFSLNFWSSSAWRCWMQAKRSLAAPVSSAPASTKLRMALRWAWLCTGVSDAGSMALYLAYSRSLVPRRVQNSVMRGRAALSAARSGGVSATLFKWLMAPQARSSCSLGTSNCSMMACQRAGKPGAVTVSSAWLARSSSTSMAGATSCAPMRSKGGRSEGVRRGLSMSGCQGFAALRSVACMVLTSSMVMVIGPTPPGTGVIQPATCLTRSKSTSPQSLPSAWRLMPTSMTMAPGLTISAVSIRARPTAATPMSAWRGWEPREGGAHDVGVAGVVAQVGGGAVAQRHCGIGLQQQQGHGFADGLAAPHDHCVPACDGLAGGFDQFHAAVWRAGAKAVQAGQQRPGRQHRVAVHILGAGNRLGDPVRVDVFGQRHLHQDAMHAGVGIQGGNAFEQRGLAQVGGVFFQDGAQAVVLAGADFVAHVDGGGRVFADQDHGQTGRGARGRQGRSALRQRAA